MKEKETILFNYQTSHRIWRPQQIVQVSKTHKHGGHAFNIQYIRPNRIKRKRYSVGISIDDLSMPYISIIWRCKKKRRKRRSTTQTIAMQIRLAIDPRAQSKLKSLLLCYYECVCVRRAYTQAYGLIWTFIICIRLDWIGLDLTKMGNEKWEANTNWKHMEANDK